LTYLTRLFSTAIDARDIFHRGHESELGHELPSALRPKAAGHFLSPEATTSILENGSYYHESNYSRAESRYAYHLVMAALEQEMQAAWYLSLLHPRGLKFVNLYTDRDLLNFALGLPPTFRILPAGGRLIEKPVLRLAYVDRLPPKVVRRNWHAPLGRLEELLVIRRGNDIAALIGRKSLLAELGVIEPSALEATLSNVRDFPNSPQSIARACMVELWLRSL
jgi:hypothetical protein